MKIPGIPNAPGTVEFEEKECALFVAAMNNSLDLIQSGIFDFITKERLAKIFYGFERTTHLVLTPSPDMRKVFILLISNELDKTNTADKEKVTLLKGILSKLNYDHRAN
ncbi:MAG: hypothetical protein M1334_03650 [Patescibacteria group bacterium]|nr:hypothetical protein [Patescibacteria group bacterium]